MGKVYLGTDTSLDRKVAVKKLNSELTHDSSFLERFTNEAKILSRLSHPNVALLYNYIRDESGCYMVMEYVEGDNMDELIRRHGALPYRVAAPIIFQALDGLDHAHRKGVLHRDIKPANLMLTPDATLKIMDFGIARVAGDTNRLTRVKSIVGTLEYVAPELIQGAEPSGASDCYALGVTLYEMATGGVLPFKGTSEFSLMQAICGAKPIAPDQVNKAVPKKMAALILKAIEKDPAKRFTDAKSFQLALADTFSTTREIDLQLFKKNPPPATVLSAGSHHPRSADETKVAIPLTTQVIPEAKPHAVPVPPVGLRVKWPHVFMACAVLLLFVALFFLLRSDPLPEGRQAEAKPGTTAYVMPEQQQATLDGSSDPVVGNAGALTVVDQQTTGDVPATATTDRPDGSTEKPVGPTGTSQPERSPTIGNEPEPRPEKPADEVTPTVSDTENEPKPQPAEINERKPPGTSGSVTLSNRVAVNLHMQDQLTSQNLTEGKPLSFTVTAPVVYKQHTIIPQGAVATAVISKVSSKQVSIRFRTVKGVSGEDIPFNNTALSGKISEMLSSKSFMVMLDKGIIVKL